MPLTVHLLLAAALVQALIAVAFALSQVHLSDALDGPVSTVEDCHPHIEVVRRALSRTVPLALVAVAVSGVLARPALSVFVPGLTRDWVDPSDVVRGVFAALWVFGVCMTAALLNIAFGLRARLGQLRSAR